MIVQEADKQKEAQLTNDDPGAEVISEGEDSSDDKDINDPVTVIEDKYMIESQRGPRLSLYPTIAGSVPRKRQCSASVDTDDETSPCLPSCEVENSTQRRAGLRGQRKGTKIDDGQWTYY